MKCFGDYTHNYSLHCMQVSHSCLSLLGRVLVYRGRADHPEGDPLAINIWKGCVPVAI